MNIHQELTLRLRRYYLVTTNEHVADGELQLVLERTRLIRPRPRWLVGLHEERAAVSRLPWGAIAIAALILLGIAVGAILIAKAPARELPAPYGPAGNGLVVYALAGRDIYIGDPETRATQAIIAGPEVDTNPAFSPNGAELVFLRHTVSDPPYTGHHGRAWRWLRAAPAHRPAPDRSQRRGLVG